MTETFPSDREPDAARQRGAKVLRNGLLVVAPTDTVYGVFADAFSMEATQRLIGVRDAGRDAPLTVFVRSPRQLSGLAAYTSEQAERLVAAFWPGPLTIVLTANEGLAWDLGDSHGTVAVRMPAEQLIYELVAEIGPLACSAACRAGEAPPRTVDGARQQLGDAVGLYLDGGYRPGGASTIVDCSRGGAEVLRSGAISADDILKAATGVVGWGRPVDAAPEAGAALEPGEVPDAGSGPEGGAAPAGGARSDPGEAPRAGAALEPDASSGEAPEPGAAPERGRTSEAGEAPGHDSRGA